MTIVDRRNTGTNRSAVNKKRFFDRFKKGMARGVKDLVIGKDVKDLEDGIDVDVYVDQTEEPSFGYQQGTGTHDHVLPGNKDYQVGDKIGRPRTGGEKGYKGETVQVHLTKHEMLELLFDGLELPNFIKLSDKAVVTEELHRAGYVKEGVPSRLDVKKTFEQAIARRMALKDAEYKGAFIEDVDLRYRHYQMVKQPKQHATMICITDVSGSMGDEERTMSKSFYWLLYLFLTTKYDHVDIRYIAHTEQAWEMTHQEFFAVDYSGGTYVMSALELAKSMIEDMNISSTNLYIAHCSDGDVFGTDGIRCRDMIAEYFQPIVQYYMYCQVDSTSEGGPPSLTYQSLYRSFYDLFSQHDNLELGFANDQTSVLKAFKRFFNPVKRGRK